MKKSLDSDFFTRLFVSERKQIALMADEKSHTRVSRRLFATSRSEMEIKMSFENVREDVGMQELIRLAIEAREQAYTPYSGFKVGAALLCRDGKIFCGCNIENAAYSPTNCAERTAFFKAVSEGEREFVRIAIVGGKEGEMVAPSPCGVCLQVMSEFCKPESFEVVMAKSETDYTVKKLSELLPFGFSL